LEAGLGPARLGLALERGRALLLEEIVDHIDDEREPLPL
jgi:hypothetical protein